MGRPTGWLPTPGTLTGGIMVSYLLNVLCILFSKHSLPFLFDYKIIDKILTVCFLLQVSLRSCVGRTIVALSLRLWLVFLGKR